MRATPRVGAAGAPQLVSFAPSARPVPPPSLASTLRVKDFCIARGYSWSASVAQTACGEQEYYDELTRHYRLQKRVSGCLLHLPVDVVGVPWSHALPCPHVRTKQRLRFKRAMPRLGWISAGGRSASPPAAQLGRPALVYS